MKKIPVIITMLLTFISAQLSADNDTQAIEKARKEKASFYSKIQAVHGYSDGAISSARGAGYGSYLTLLFLEISRLSGKPVREIAALRSKGYSLAEIAIACGVDYAKLVEAVEKDVRDNAIIFPVSDGDEMKNDAASMPASAGNGVAQ